MKPVTSGIGPLRSKGAWAGGQRLSGSGLNPNGMELDADAAPAAANVVVEAEDTVWVVDDPDASVQHARGPQVQRLCFSPFDGGDPDIEVEP